MIRPTILPVPVKWSPSAQTRSSEVEDMHSARYACYLVVQDADPAKEVGALA
jgi:hypothetical protein